MPPPARTPTHSQLPTGRGTVLVVEDDPDVRMLVKKVLLGCGYEVHVAADGLEALRYLEGLAQPPRLVMTDVVMPHMNGRQLGDHVRANLPDTKVLYMTGYDDPAADSPIALRADDVILRKPFSPSNLAWTVHHLFEDAADSLLD
jgi:CheY-like chemotaxis protein